MLTHKSILMMTVAAAVCAAPLLAFGQANTGGSSMQSTTTQTTPNQGALSAPAARDAATTGTEHGPSAGTGPVAPRGGGQAGQSNVQGNRDNNNPSGAATGSGMQTSGGTGAAPGAPPSVTGGGPAANTQNRAEADRGAERSAHGNLGSGAANSTAGNAAPGAATPGSSGSGMNSGATGAGTGAMAAEGSGMRGGRRASRVIGSTVYNENNESIGEVEDILLPQGGGQPMAVLSVGGFLGIGSRLVTVPYDRLQRSGSNERWTLQGATRDSVRTMPEFRYEEERRG